MAKISKAILGLMTVILLAVTMVPFGLGDIDNTPNGVLANGSKLFTIIDDDDSTITLEWNTFNGVGVAAATLTLTDANGKTYVEAVTISDNHGTQSTTITLEDLRAGGNVVPPVGTGIPLPLGFSGALDVVINNGAAVLTDEIWVEVGLDSPDNSISTDMFEDETNDLEVIDQTGDDALNPGDDFTAYIEIDADDDDANVVYHGMYVEGRLYDTVTGEYFGMDETKTFTLGDESRVTKELSFSIPRQLELTNDKEANRLTLEVDVYAYEQTLDEDTRGHTELTYKFDLEANEDSLYISEATVAPSSVEAGDSISVDAEICNDGVETQENIEVTAEILGLGVTYTRNIMELANDDCESWSTGMVVPSNAKAGTYDVEITAVSEAGAKTTYIAQLEVEGAAAPRESDLDVVEDDLTLTNGKATFTFELTNDGDERKVYELDVDGADAELSQEKITVDAGETETFTVTLTEEGEATVFAKADGEVVSETVTAQAAGTVVPVDKEQVVEVLKWVFAVIVIIAIILVIVWAVTKGRKNGDGKSEVYY